MKNKIIAILTVVSIWIGILPVSFANETEYTNPYQIAELYRVEVQSGKVILNGRWFGDADKSITASLKSSKSTTETTGKPFSSDGSFMLTVEFSDYTTYDVEISGEEGTAEFLIDLSGLSELFNTNGSFVINSLGITHNRYYLSGCHNGNKAQSITMTAVSENEAAENDGLLALRQVKSEENGNFEIEFNMSPTKMQLNLSAKGLSGASYTCTLPDKDIYSIDENDENALVTKLNDMINILDEMAYACAEKKIATDYEDINREIIRKFISNIQTEIHNGALARLGQYNYALTKLYLQAYHGMNSYLEGTKNPFSVPEYVTGEISTDGINIVGNVKKDEDVYKAPVFFTGFSGWDNVAEEIPFLSKAGFNTIQTELKMYDVLVEDDVNLWSVRTSNEPEITFETAVGTAKTGSNSLHIDATEISPENAYKYVFQTIPVKPDTTYKYGLWAKGDINVEKSVHINLNGLTGAGRKHFESKADWYNYDYTYKTAPDQTEITLVILSEAYSGKKDVSDYYIDDIYLKEQGSDINLIKNGSFEEKREVTDLDKEAAELGLYIDRERIEWLKGILASAEEHGVMVDLGIGPYYLPYYIREIEGVEDGGRGFTNYSLTNETVRKVVSLWTKILISVIEDYDSVKTLCLMNEPEVHANLSNHYDDEWIAFLKERYNNNIYSLNKNYGTAYADFSQVIMPRDYLSDGSIGTDRYKIYRTPVYYDYIEFNDGILEGFVEWFSKEAKSINSDLKLHVKYMEYFRNDYRRYHNQGTNWEKLSQHLDINGCDAHSYYETREETPMTLKMANYDFMTSVKDAPIIDSESHIIDDPPIVLENGEKTPMYSDKIRRYIGAEIWNGAIHGGTIRQYWIWDMHKMSMPWGTRKNQNANFALRPEELATMGKAAKDLMRLSNEVSALQNTERNVAILYSRTNAGYSESTRLNPYMQSIQAAYEELVSTGQRVGFVTDSSPSDMHKYKLLVITDTTNISADMLNELKSYLENGGKVVLKNSTLANDEYEKEHNAETLSYIRNNAVVDGDISDTVDSLGISEIKIVDAKTGNYPSGIEWLYAKHNGKYIINIMNYDEDNAVELKLYYGDREVTSAEELRSGSTLSSLTAKPMSPILLSIGDGAFDLVDENGEILKANITELERGNIRCNLPVNGTQILAIYKDDVLVNVSFNQNTITFKPTGNGNYRLMSADWDISTHKPMRESRNIKMEVYE